MSATEIILSVQGMHCGSCGLLIDEALEDLAGVRRSETSLRAGTTTIQVDLDACPAETLVAEVVHLGYTAKLRAQHT